MQLGSGFHVFGHQRLRWFISGRSKHLSICNLDIWISFDVRMHGLFIINVGVVG